MLDSVVFYMPFFSTQIVDGEETEFELDSVFGNEPIKISVFESNFFLRDNDPNSSFEDPQLYYSNQKPVFENNLGALIFEIDDFKPSNDAIVLNDTVSLPPGLRLKLPIEFFEDKILSKDGEPELLNNNNFREYFRGLYFKVDDINGNGNLTFLDLENDDNPANITLHYTAKLLGEGEDCKTTNAEAFNGDVQLLFNAIKVNVFNSEIGIGATPGSNPNTTLGEETLFVRGGDGFVTIVELFGDEDFKQTTEVNDELFLVDGANGVPDELDELRTKRWLINEANLLFYVDQDKVTGGTTEPDRIIIFDTKNNTALADYSLDITGSETAATAVNQHLGPLERGSDENGEFYKIRITTHLSNLINRDSTNIPLGVMVSQNVTELGFQELQENQVGEEFLGEVPATSVIAPQGTVLHGNRSSNINKRLKLRIYYTEPE